MAKKYYLFLELIIIFQINPIVCFGQQNKRGIVLEITELSTDTCYQKNSIFEISVMVKNKGLVPHSLYTDWCISENVVNHEVEGELFLIVTHDGITYRYYKPIILYKHALPRKHILWFRKVRCHGRFYMNNFLKKMTDGTNYDYGNYIIKAAFVKAPYDTVFSNPVKMLYLE